MKINHENFWKKFQFFSDLEDEFVPDNSCQKYCPDFPWLSDTQLDHLKNYCDKWENPENWKKFKNQIKAEHAAFLREEPVPVLKPVKSKKRKSSEIESESPKRSKLEIPQTSKISVKSKLTEAPRNSEKPKISVKPKKSKISKKPKTGENSEWKIYERKKSNTPIGFNFFGQALEKPKISKIPKSSNMRKIYKTDQLPSDSEWKIKSRLFLYRMS